MATTHAYTTLALAAASLPVTGRHAPASAVLLAAAVGGALPDLDLLSEHRRTLHFPVLFPVGACVALVAYGVVGGQSLFLLAVVVAAAGVHSATDLLAGGVGYRPWENGSDRAVYNHLLGRWHAPRRVVRYSGAPEDFALGAAFALPAVLSSATGPTVDAAVLVSLAGSGCYAASRRHLAAAARSLLPRAVVERLPGVRAEDPDPG
jgi:hypothetical protein